MRFFSGGKFDMLSVFFGKVIMFFNVSIVFEIRIS